METGSTVTVAISTLGCFFSASPLFSVHQVDPVSPRQTSAGSIEVNGRSGVFMIAAVCCCCYCCCCCGCCCCQVIGYGGKFSVTAKLIIGLVQPVSTGLIAANSLSRCISPHAHMEEIKPAKLIQTPNIFSSHIAAVPTHVCVCTYVCVHMCVHLP